MPRTADWVRSGLGRAGLGGGEEREREKKKLTGVSLRRWVSGPSAAEDDDDDGDL